MEDIELVIKIPEEIRVAITRMGLLRIPDEMQKKVDRAIQKGIPLPKGHGDLIDRSKLLKEPMDIANYPSNYVRIAKAIIKAESEEQQC